MQVLHKLPAIQTKDKTPNLQPTKTQNHQRGKQPVPQHCFVLAKCMHQEFGNFGDGKGLVLVTHVKMEEETMLASKKQHSGKLRSGFVQSCSVLSKLR